MENQDRLTLSSFALQYTSVRFKVSDLRMGIRRPYWSGPSPVKVHSSSRYDPRHPLPWPEAQAKSAVNPPKVVVRKVKTKGCP
jgi:hypothetical protein